MTCTCTVVAPRRESASVPLYSRYSAYIDAVDDDTNFDPECPFHGERGSMVVTVPTTLSSTRMQ